MKLDRPGIAILIISFLGGAVYVYGVERVGMTAVVFFLGLWLYASLARQLK